MTDVWTMTITIKSSNRDGAIRLLEGFPEYWKSNNYQNYGTAGGGAGGFGSIDATFTGPPESPLTDDEIRKLRALLT